MRIINMHNDNRQLMIEYLKDKVRSGEYEIEVYKKKYYPASHVFDENKSVKWNRELVREKNKEIRYKLDKYKEERNSKAEEFLNDVKHVVLSNRDYLSDKSYNRLVDIIKSDRLTPLERKFRKSANMLVFLTELDDYIKKLDRIFYTPEPTEISMKGSDSNE